MRVPVVVVRFGARPVHEPALLQLPPGRAPPQGAIVSSIVTVDEPGGPDHGFDERQWLGRKGVHVVLRADTWRGAGRRGGLGGLADQLVASRRRSSAARQASGAPFSPASFSATTRRFPITCATDSEDQVFTTSSLSREKT